jgi:hypothetical protein
MSRNREKFPEAERALDKLKYEVAAEEGIELKDGYNGDITAREAGKIGGGMVKRMLEYAEKHMEDSNKH